MTEPAYGGMSTHGELVCRTVVVDDEDRVYVGEAPPRIRMSFELWGQVANDRWHAPRIRVNDFAHCVGGMPMDTAIGALVTITAENGEWIYRVTGCDYPREMLELSWPD